MPSLTSFPRRKLVNGKQLLSEVFVMGNSEHNFKSSEVTELLAWSAISTRKTLISITWPKNRLDSQREQCAKKKKWRIKEKLSSKIM
jgi:hypothetical protein